MIFTSSKEHYTLQKNNGFCECCIMTFLKTTIRDKDNHYYKKILRLPRCGVMSFFRVRFVIVGCSRCGKGKDGEKGEEIGEKSYQTPSLFSSFFSVPLPASLHLPLRLLWLLWTRYTLGFSKAAVCLVSRKTHPAYHITNIFCLNTKSFFILIGNYMYVYIQFIIQITKLFAS